VTFGVGAVFVLLLLVLIPGLLVSFGVRCWMGADRSPAWLQKIAALLFVAFCLLEALRLLMALLL